MNAEESISLGKCSPVSKSSAESKSIHRLYYCIESGKQLKTCNVLKIGLSLKYFSV